MKELDSAITQTNGVEESKKQDSPVKAVPSGNSSRVSAEETAVNDENKITDTLECSQQQKVPSSASSTDSTHFKDAKSELKNVVSQLENNKGSAVAEVAGETTSSENLLLQNTSIPSASETKIQPSLSENVSEPVESVLKNSGQSNKKKVNFF